MIEQQEAAQFLAEVATARVKGDVGALTNFFHDDAHFMIVGLGDAVTGKEALRATLQSLIEQFEFLEWQQIGAFAHGNEVAARHRLKVRHCSSGNTVETETAEFLTVRDGKCASFVQFADTALIAAMSSGGGSQSPGTHGPGNASMADTGLPEATHPYGP